MKYEKDPKFWEYFREERDRLERIDRTLAVCRPVPMTIGEISDVMGIPYDSVRTILNRSIKKMRQHVKQMEVFNDSKTDMGWNTRERGVRVE